MKKITDRVVDEFLLAAMQVHTYVMCYFELPEMFSYKEDTEL